MAAYKFYNIGKANAEIERLETALAAASAVKPDAAVAASLAEAVASNETISAELTAANLKITPLESANTDLTAKLTAEQSRVTALTTDNAGVNTKLAASEALAAARLAEISAAKTALAQKCLSSNCLTLNGADGKPLAQDATAEAKLAAALKLSSDELLTAYAGSVNAAAARVGVKLETVPSAGATPPAGAAKKLTLDEECRQAKAAQSVKK